MLLPLSFLRAVSSLFRWRKFSHQCAAALSGSVRGVGGDLVCCMYSTSHEVGQASLYPKIRKKLQSMLSIYYKSLTGFKVICVPGLLVKNA